MKTIICCPRSSLFTITSWLVLLAGGAGCYRTNQNSDEKEQEDLTIETDTPSDTAPDLGSDTYIDPCPGEPDFTPCSILTEPDRDYDICSDGTCQSPGCGELSCNVPGQAFPVSDTGQVVCYGGASSPIDCPGEAGSEECANIPFCGQDAQYRYEHPDRFFRSTEVTDRPVVEDRSTGLTWQGCLWSLFGDHCDKNDDVEDVEDALGEVYMDQRRNSGAKRLGSGCTIRDMVSVLRPL